MTREEGESDEDIGLYLSWSRGIGIATHRYEVANREDNGVATATHGV